MGKCLDSMTLGECAEFLAARLVERAADMGKTVCTAESCTAGMVASTIAGVPGASAVLRGGAVTYCDEVKRRVLGVSEATLAEYTAVSTETAGEMAHGALELFCADVAVSLTGYAGPGGGTERDPAGTVYMPQTCRNPYDVTLPKTCRNPDDVTLLQPRRCNPAATLTM